MKENIKDKIIIQNVLKYENDKGAGVRVGFYIANDKLLSSNNNFKGYSENACFYRELDVFEKIPVELIGKVVDCTFKSIPSLKNPMRSISVVESIYHNGNTIRLLQSE